MWGKTRLCDQGVQAEDVGVLQGPQSPPAEIGDGLVKDGLTVTQRELNLRVKHLAVDVPSNAKSHVLLVDKQAPNAQRIMHGIPQLGCRIAMPTEPQQIEMITPD